jgi:hypothetical protein
MSAKAHPLSSPRPPSLSSPPSQPFQPPPERNRRHPPPQMAPPPHGIPSATKEHRGLTATMEPGDGDGAGPSPPRSAPEERTGVRRAVAETVEAKLDGGLVREGSGPMAGSGLRLEARRGRAEGAEVAGTMKQRAPGCGSPKALGRPKATPREPAKPRLARHMWPGSSGGLGYLGPILVQIWRNQAASPHRG